MHVNDVANAQLQLVLAVWRVRRDAAEPESDKLVMKIDQQDCLNYRSVTPGETALLALFSLSPLGLVRALDVPEALALAES